MLTISPTFWRPGNVISAVFIGGFCLIPAVFLLGSPTAAIGPALLVVVALMVWLLMRPIRLEITETEVRADEGGWTRAPLGKKEAFRSEISSIRYVPKRYTFYGADGQALMAISNTWTMPDMVKAAEVLRVPLYDDRAGRAKGNGVNRGRLLYDPGSGLTTGT